MRLQIGKSEFHGFHLQVDSLGRKAGVLRGLEMLEHAKRHLRTDPLTIRWNFIEAMVFVVKAKWFDPVAFMSCKVVFGDIAPTRSRKSCNRSGDIATIKGLTAGLRDFLKRFCLVRITPDLALNWGPSRAGKRVDKAWILLEHRHRFSPMLCNDPGDCKAISGIANC